MKILITLLSIITSISAHAVVSCNDMKKEVLKIDQILDEEIISCPKEIDQKLCEKNYGQLINQQHDLMSELVMLNGLAQLREEAAQSAKDLAKFRQYDQTQLKQKFEQFKTALNNIDFTQSSFTPIDNKHLWRDYDEFVESKKLKNDSAALLQYIEAKCSESKFKICDKKEELKKDNKYQEILRGLASTLSKKKALSDSDYAKTVENYRSLLNIPWEGENKVATDVLTDDRIERFEQLIDHNDEKISLQEKYEALSKLNTEFIRIAAWDNPEDELITHKKMVKDASTSLSTELKNVLALMKNAGNIKTNEVSDTLIKQLATTITSQENNEAFKLKKLKQQIQKQFPVTCANLADCKKEVEEIANKSCNPPEQCNFEKTLAKDYLIDLNILEQSNVSQKLIKSKQCIVKKKGDFQAILSCSELTEVQLDAQRKLAHNKLRDIEKLLKNNSENEQIKALKSFKNYALYILRNQPQCLEQNDIQINSPCLANGIEQLGISTFIADLNDVIAVEAVNLDPKFARSEGEKVRDFCLDDETLKLFPQICNNTPPVDVSAAMDIPEDDFVPVTVKYNAKKYGHPAMLGVRGLLSAAATTGLMGYVEYNTRVQNANELVTKVKMQKEMDALYSQQSIYQQTFYNQMAQNYYTMMKQQKMWGSQYYTQGGTYFTGGLNPSLFAPQNQSNLSNSTFQFDFNQVPDPVNFSSGGSSSPTPSIPAAGEVFPSFGF